MEFWTVGRDGGGSTAGPAPAPATWPPPVAGTGSISAFSSGNKISCRAPVNAADICVLLALVWLVVRLEWTRSENATAHAAITKNIDDVKENLTKNIDGVRQNLTRRRRGQAGRQDAADRRRRVDAGRIAGSSGSE